MRRGATSDVSPHSAAHTPFFMTLYLISLPSSLHTSSFLSLNPSSNFSSLSIFPLPPLPILPSLSAALRYCGADVLSGTGPLFSKVIPWRTQTAECVCVCLCVSVFKSEYACIRVCMCVCVQCSWCMRVCK